MRPLTPRRQPLRAASSTARYFEAPPGLQLLHCLKNSTTGGNSTFADGFKAAELLSLQHPQHYLVRDRGRCVARAATAPWAI